MNTKSITFIIIVIALLVVVLWPGEKETETVTSQSPTPQMSTQRSPHSSPMSSTDLPTVESAFVQVKNSADEILEPYKLITGEKTEIKELGVSLRLTEFYSHWNWDGQAVNRSLEEVNPAVRIEIFRDGKPDSYGWAFMHTPFFSMSGHSDGSAEESDKLTFTMISYDGLEMPTSKTEAEDA